MFLHIDDQTQKSFRGCGESGEGRMEDAGDKGKGLEGMGKGNVTDDFRYFVHCNVRRVML